MKIAQARDLAAKLTAAADKAEAAGQEDVELGESMLFESMDDAARQDLVDAIAGK